MRPWWHNAAVPVYLLLCLLLGGSRQGIWSNAVLQLLGLFLIAWAMISRRNEPPPPASRKLVALTIAAMVLILAQLVPLPPPLWTGLPGRDTVVRGFDLLGYELPWLPLSLAPYETLEASYAIVPALAVIAVMIGLNAVKKSWIAGAVVAGALANVVLGSIQVASASTAEWAYFYKFTNSGAVGFFANRNHMATLLLAAIPFAGALFAVALPQVKSRSKAFAMLSFGAAGFLIVLAGLVLNDSLAALALAIPVTAVTALLLPLGSRLRLLILPLAGTALLASIVALGNSAIGSEPVEARSPEASYSRPAIWKVTGQAIAGTFPAGTGVGTFRRVYVLQEDPAAIGVTFVNHAHNDYLEALLETGLAGLVLMILFLIWWAVHSAQVWRSPASTQFAKAATIASAAILAHSIVDYPLRTSAIAALFAACIGMIAQVTMQRRADEPRHVTPA